ncbi:hypothetical protein EYF80_024583 [Liparis tanakae]|uniref:Uncharacterized protein n=1 Tax=Liparis tanakae TaxID=230148 RepID=A0A4Z2HHD6_9TELE|nr:hypothetical protein EYF80_024583 [Liparis tanakae]
MSSSDAADTGSFRPLSSSSSTVRSPEMALRISGPIPDPLEFVEMMRPQDGPITCQVVKVVHDDGHKQVDDLRMIGNQSGINKKWTNAWEVMTKGEEDDIDLKWEEDEGQEGRVGQKMRSVVIFLT